MIRVHPGLEELSRDAADLFVELAAGAIARHGHFDVALAGGNTPKRTYELLADPRRAGAVDWTRVHVFWGDERCVPPDDDRSNAQMARRALLDHVPVPDDHVHAVDCRAARPPEAATAYERVLRRHFGEGTPPPWDLVFLGLGADGHTASLLPDSPLLVEGERWVREADPPDHGGVGRVTLTPIAIRSAHNVVFLVSGSGKARALSTARTMPRDPTRRPAHAVSPVSGRVVWLVDAAAAGIVQPGRSPGGPAVSP